jgi:hypothetical protein
MTPGKSTWGDLDALFRSLGGIGLAPRNSEVTARLDFMVGVDPGHSLQPAAFAVIERQGVIEGFDARFALHEGATYPFPSLDEAAQGYSLPNFLASNGPPTQVLVDLPSAQAEPGAGWIYGVWLYYEEKGIAAFFAGRGLSWQGDKLQVCPSYRDTLWIDLFLRDPSDSLSLEQITAGQAAIPSQLASGQLATIDAVSSLTAEDFFQFLSSPGGCFEASPTG